jgi:hypothetical protein
MNMLKIIYKNQDQVNTVAFVNPDHILYLSGNTNGTTYIKLTNDVFLFAQEPIDEVLKQLEDLYA